MTKAKKTEISTTTVGAIDIGSNSIRMVIAQVFSDGKYEIMERLQQPLYLGQDTFRKGRISNQSIRAAALILRKYIKVLQTYDVQQVQAVATSAVREASNRDTFLDRIFVSTGLNIRVISASEESHFYISALNKAVGRKFLAKRKTLVVQVGGGSTILNIVQKGEIQLTQPLTIGTIRLQEVLGTSSETLEKAASLIENQINSGIAAILEMLKLKKIQNLIGIGGNLQWIAKEVGISDEKTGLVNVTSKNLKDLIAEYRQCSANHLAGSLKIPFVEAETLTPGLMVYYALLRATSATQITVCNVSMCDSLLLDMAGKITGKGMARTSLHTLKTAKALAMKFQVNLKHADHVCKISSNIYDVLEQNNFMHNGRKLLLQIAAILHEVGMFINSRAYHKHSYYIITNSHVFGLEPKELEITAQISRYHRKSRPKASHPEYSRLNREDRMTINKLAAILRVADSLDVNRTGDIKDISCRIENDEFIINVPGNSDLVLERRTIAAKGALFEEVYGLKIRFEQDVNKD